MSEPKEVYLGDGCYASYDGYMLKLRAPRIGGDHEVYLEPDVMQAFMAFVERAYGLKITVEKVEKDRGWDE
jgi:hypothetical protein